VVQIWSRVYGLWIMVRGLGFRVEGVGSICGVDLDGESVGARGEAEHGEALGRLVPPQVRLNGRERQR